MGVQGVVDQKSRTPESLDQEYPPTEAVHEARRNIYERLLGYASKEDGGIARGNCGFIQPNPAVQQLSG
mgnify:CR=1 FL=1